MEVCQESAAMQSDKSRPFPGMDPYLEDDAFWPKFHRELVMGIYQILQPVMFDRYSARLGQRCYSTPSPAGDTEHRESYLEIRERMNDRLVTLLDVVSPANKTTAAGRYAYLERRRIAQEARANLVEIDLVLQGQPMLEYLREGLPEWHYSVTVTRSNKPQRSELYTSTLQKRLPRFRLPLASDDRDTVLDLHVAFTRCYDHGGYAEKIDYSREPAHGQIAPLAYAIWQREGCPHGRDKEYWLAALAQFRVTR
jgi:hypothetical protein